MKRGISVHWGSDYLGQTALVVEKKRGRLTLDEIQDAIMHGPNAWSLYGNYAILLNFNEGVDIPTWGDDPDQREGDAVLLYPVNESEDCPVCGQLVPPYKYCPHCGEKWDRGGNT